MAWLAVDKDGLECLYLEKPERLTHYNVFNPREIDFEIWASNKSNLKLEKGTIKKLTGREISWKDEPIEI